MRQLLAAVLFIVLVQEASAQSGPTKADHPMSVPQAAENTEAELTMKLAEFKTQMEAAGFKEVQISPALVLQAKDKEDQPITMLIDPQRMIGIELNGSPESETTGSGSAVDLERD